MSPSDFADLMYAGPRAKVSHWVPWGDFRALCGATEIEHTAWFGTGSMDEYDRAEQLPLCVKCGAKS